MIFYVSIMIFFLGASIFSKEYKKFTVLVFATLLGSLMAFKASSIGNDTSNYILFFERLKDVSTFFDDESRFEYGYQFFSKSIALLSLDYQFVFIFSAIICMFCVGKCIFDYSENVAYSFFLFVSLRFFYFYLSGIRQAIAVSLVFFAFRYLIKSEFFKFMLFVFLATSFHNSAIIFLFAWPLSRIPLCKRGVLTLTIGSLLGYSLFAVILPVILSFLPIYYTHYTNSVVFSSNNIGNFVGLGMKIIVILFVALSGFVETNSEKKMLAENSKIKSTLVYFLIFSACLSLFSTRASLLDRIEMYYWIYVVMLIPLVVSEMEKYKKVVFYYVIAIFTIAYNVLLLIYKPEWNNIIPYRFFWD